MTGAEGLGSWGRIDNECGVIRVDTQDSVEWDDVADVLIAGYGGAGICAALELAEGGADVLAIDRFAGGGATAFSGGVVYAGNTLYQKACGYEDSAAEMQAYLAMEVGDAVTTETLRRFCQQSPENLRWLEAHGVEFGSTLYEGKITYPPEGFFLQFSGNEKVAEYARAAKPAPRGHRTKGRGFTGKYLYAALRNAADAQSIRFRPHTVLDALICDADGHVVGARINKLPASAWKAHQKLYDEIKPTVPFKEVRAERNAKKARALEADLGSFATVRAKKGIILATGGYAFNLEMLGQFAPSLAEHYASLIRLGTLGDDGSAYRIGSSVNAKFSKAQSMFVGRVQSPPLALLDGILVNRSGHRFVNEAVYLGTLGRSIVDQPGGEAWLILPASSLRKAVRQIFTGGMHAFKLFGAPALLNIFLGGTRRAANAFDLARKCGIDPDGLAAQIAQYDLAVAAGEDTSYSKLSDHLLPLSNSRLVALNVSLRNRFTFLQLMTLGGLAVDEADGTVLDDRGQRISGLYAAGRAAAGVPSNRYISGLSLADCVFSGRRAARACLDAPVA